MVSLWDSFKLEVPSVKQDRPGVLRLLRRPRCEAPLRVGPRNGMLRIGDCGLKDAGRGWVPEAKCAKRTQFRPAGGGWRRKLCKTKPNLGGLGYVGKGSCRVRRGSAGQ
jgi:hypothetical protein